MTEYLHCAHCKARIAQLVSVRPFAGDIVRATDFVNLDGSPIVDGTMIVCPECGAGQVPFLSDLHK